jgi:AAA+ ATPase superfamily predicted ATPase
VLGRLIDRAAELAALEAAANARGGQLVTVWGRRRAGKTYLLQAFVTGRRCLYYAATQQSAPVELAAFTEAARALFGDGQLPAGYIFPNSTVALDFVTRAAGDERLIVVLDEFPYLAESTRGLESIVQRWWDQSGRASRVMLILCGSAVAYMQQIGGAAAPLHQRATASIRVAPFDYEAAGEVVPMLPPTERAVVYGILGGTPLYLEQWDPHASRRANLLRLFGNPASPLVDAAELVLSGELPELEGAFRILQAIALGHTRPSAITDYARVAVERPLKRLTTLGIIERRVPALEDPARTRRAIYRIADPYFAFWFRFIASNRSQIARGPGAQLIDQRVLPYLDDYMGSVFEEIAREHPRKLAALGELEADRVEAWWSADGLHEIDLVGISGRDRIQFIGTVKWSARRLGRDVLKNLDEHAAGLPNLRPGIPRLVYGRSGCMADLLAVPNVRCFSADDLYPMREAH